MSSIRDKYRKRKLQTMSDKQKEQEELLKGDNSRMEIVRPKLGEKIKVRLFPSHEAKNTYAEAVSFSWLPFLKEVEDEKDPTKKKLVKYRKPIFNSRIHGDKTLPDPVELYKEAAIRIGKEVIVSDTKERGVGLTSSQLWKQYVKDFKENVHKEIWGHKKDGKWVAGIFSNYKPSYRLYAESGGLLVELEVNSEVMSKIDALCIDPETDNVVDKFCDIDEGVYLFIEVNKKDDGKRNYIVKAGNKKQPVPEKLLEELESKESLFDRFVNVYSSKDFQLATEGLKNVDDEYEYGIFEDEKFISDLEDLAKNYPVDEDEEGKKEEESEEGESEKSGDRFDRMNRKELKDYISLTSHTRGKVKFRNISDDGVRTQIRELLVEASLEEGLPFDKNSADSKNNVKKSSAKATSDEQGADDFLDSLPDE